MSQLSPRTPAFAYAVNVDDTAASPHHKLDILERQTMEPSPVVMTAPGIDAEIAKTENDKPKPEPKAKVLFLDGMRGFAAMLVVCAHLGYLQGRGIGQVGVHTFFVLSAFLLTMLFEKKVEALYNQRASPKRWVLALVDYAVRRVLRVYPLVMAIGFLLAVSSDSHKHQWYDYTTTKEQHFNWFWMLLFIKGHAFYVFWTLPLELKYYLVIPLFVLVTVCLRRWWWVPMLPLTGWVVWYGLHVYVDSSSGFYGHFHQFLIGSVGAVVYNRLSSWIKKTGFMLRLWHRIVIWAIEAVVAILLISAIFDALIFDPKWLGRYPFAINDSDHFICVHVVILILLEMISPGPISSFFEWSLLRYAGKISFSMYLVHPRIIHSDFILDQGNFYTKFFAVWILVFFWCTVTFQIIEYPGQWLAGVVGKKIKTLDTKEREKEKKNNSYEIVANS